MEEPGMTHKHMTGMGVGSPTKQGELYRTIEVLDTIIEENFHNGKALMMVLYFLHDSGYDNKDLGDIAKLIELIKKNKNLPKR